MAAEQFFTRIANQVLDATERLSNHFDDNLSLLFGSTSNDNNNNNNINSNGNIGVEKDQDTEDFMDDTYHDGNPLQGMAEQVLSGIMDGQAQPQTPLESFHAFRSAITWTEPFILSIIGFHIVMFLITIYVSRYNQNLTPRLMVLVCIAFIVRTSEYTNDYARRHWQSFSTQNYFDQHGLFMSIMVCGPLLLNSFIMLCFFLRETSQLLILVKKIQIQKQKQKQSKASQNINTSEVTTTEKDVDTKKEQ